MVYGPLTNRVQRLAEFADHVNADGGIYRQPLTARMTVLRND
jgi:hypothetical protein